MQLSDFVWQTALTTLLSTGLVALFGFALRTWIKQKIKHSIKADYDQDLEKLKSQLKTASDLSVEQYKAELKAVNDAEMARLTAELARESSRQATKYGHVAKGQIEAIQLVYSAVESAYDNLVAFTLPFRAVNVDADALRKHAFQAIREFDEIYRGNRIHLTGDTELCVEKLYTVMLDKYNLFYYGVELTIQDPERVERWNRVYQNVVGDVKAGVDDVRTRLRDLMNS